MVPLQQIIPFSDQLLDISFALLLIPAPVFTNGTAAPPKLSDSFPFILLPVITSPYESSLHVTLLVLFLVNVILWPLHSAPIYGSISLPSNCRVTERQYWPLHYRTTRLTGHWPLGSGSLRPDWPYLPGSPGVSHPEFIRTLQELHWVPYSKVTWPRRAAYIRYWLQFVYFSWG